MIQKWCYLGPSTTFVISVLFGDVKTEKNRLIRWHR